MSSTDGYILTEDEKGDNNGTNDNDNADKQQKGGGKLNI